MKTRKCPGCDTVKPATEYYKSVKTKDGLQCYCKTCKVERYKESKKKSDKKYNEKYLSIPENKEKKYKKTRQWQSNNPKKQKNYLKKYNQTEEAKSKRRKYMKKEYNEKYGKDPIYTLKLTLRNRLRMAIKNNAKKGKALEMLGCSIEEFKLYIENKFDNKMNWDNYGSYWELDHIKPCDAFNLNSLEEQKKCFIFTNIQPLEKIQNRRKSNKYE